VPIAPERVLQRLADLRPGGDCLREHRLRVGDISASTTAVPPTEGGASTPISGNSSARWRTLLVMRS
jgi:hypothetical protein